MCSGNSVRLIAILLPGINTGIGNQATLTGKFALRVGITQACRAQVVQGEICYLGQYGLFPGLTVREALYKNHLAGCLVHSRTSKNVHARWRYSQIAMRNSRTGVTDGLTQSLQTVDMPSVWSSNTVSAPPWRVLASGSPIKSSW